MKSTITAGLPEERSKEVMEEFKRSSLLRERLITLLRNKSESNKASVRAKNTYDSPSWAYVQADSIGYERAIYELISLLSSETVT